MTLLKPRYQGHQLRIQIIIVILKSRFEYMGRILRITFIGILSCAV